jgi:hypothetical protein
MSKALRDVLRFPTERTSHPARTGATVVDVATLRAREWLGRFANWIRIPGAIKPTEIHDPLTGQRIAVTVDAFFVRLTVNGRDFYFNRLTGRFDGTGSANF